MRRVCALSLVLLAAASGCDSAPSPDGIPVGLMLSFSGDLAATSINSERGFLLAIEAGNQAGGVSGKPLTVVARDTRGELARARPVARQLVEAGAVLFIGPDIASLAVELKSVLGDRTVIMPSYTTSESDIYKPQTWFVMGAGALRVACELTAQLKVDGRTNPVVIMESVGYNARLGRDLAFTYGFRQIFLPSDGTSNEQSVRPILGTPADAYLLAAGPASASSLLYTLAALGTLTDPGRWYLSPTLHTPALLETIPQGLLAGARGVATGIDVRASGFDERFAARWHDRPLDDAYPFYDAGALAVLALQRAMVKDGRIPTSGGDLAAHVVAVTQAGARQVHWNELDEGLAALRAGQEIEYVGISGRLAFDVTGRTTVASTKWWRIDSTGFVDDADPADCKPGLGPNAP